MTETAYVHRLYIKASSTEVWRAITQSAYTRRYFYGSGVESDWKKGSTFVYRSPAGQALIEGTVLESEAGRRLVLRQRFLWDAKSAAEKPSRITYEITESGATCLLTVTQDEFVEGSVAYAATVGGWPWIASGLKSVLETGSGLPGDGPSG